LGVLLYYNSPCMKIRFAPLARWRERAGVRPKVALWPVAMIFPPDCPLRHLPLAGPRIPCSVLWSGAVLPNLYKAERDCILSPAAVRHPHHYIF
jgi:hypothetical protein